MGAKLNRGASRQDYQTPPEFLSAVRTRLKIPRFLWDLAASEQNKVEPDMGWFSESDDALNQSWQIDTGSADKWMWLNPPFSNIAPWAEKAAMEAVDGAHIAMLVPASTGANWWSNYVVHDSYQLFLNGRLTFVGAKDPYPKDCALLLYTPFIRGGNAVWTWQDYA